MLTFTLGKRVFAVPLDSVVEIVEKGRVEEVPHSKPVLMGVAVYRGDRVITVLSLARALGMKTDSEGRLLLVVQAGGQVFSFPVEKTGELVPMPEDAVIESADAESPPFFRADIKGKPVIVLSLEKVFAALLA